MKERLVTEYVTIPFIDFNKGIVFAAITLPCQMSEDNFEILFDVLNAMKPGIVQPEATDPN